MQYLSLEKLESSETYNRPCLTFIPILYALIILIYESSLNCDTQKTYKFFSSGIKYGIF